MNPYSRQTTRLLWLGLALTATLLVLAFLLAAFKSRGAKARSLPVYGRVASFVLTNQDGQPVASSNLLGKVWVADIIFTRCPGPCLKMTRLMRDLQSALPPASQAKLVSLTTDAEYDSPPILKAYAQRFGADFNRWMFLTGTPKQIAEVAIDSLKLTAIPKKTEERESPADLFVHSTIFVVVDKHGQLRGIFETTGEDVDPARVKLDIVAAVRRLEDES